MSTWKLLAIGAALVVMCAGCGDGQSDPDNTNAVAYMGLAVGQSWEYDVDVGVAVLDGLVTVLPMDGEFVDGIDAWKVETRQNGLPVATRWYDITPDGLYLLGEQVKEGTVVVDRTFSTPIQILPHPLESESGFIVQTWTTTSELVEGGSETHRFDNSERASHDVPAGSFEAYHLVHTRTDTEGIQHQFNEYFVPEGWFVEFDYGEDETFALRPSS